MADRNEASPVRLTAQDERRIISKRQQRGECVACGTKLYRINLLGKKTPLKTVTKDGACVTCFDEATIGKVPRILEVLHRRTVEMDDSQTMISGLTLPVDLALGARMIEARAQQPVVIHPVNQKEEISSAFHVVSDPSPGSMVYGEGRCREHDQVDHALKNRRGSKGFMPPTSLLQQTTLAAVRRKERLYGPDAAQIIWEPATKLDICDEESSASTTPDPMPNSFKDRRMEEHVFGSKLTNSAGPRSTESPHLLENFEEPQEIYLGLKELERSKEVGDETATSITSSREQHSAEPGTMRSLEQDCTSIRDSQSHQLSKDESIRSTASSPPYFKMSSQRLQANSVENLVRTLSSASTQDRTSRVAALKGISDMILEQGSDAQRALAQCRGLETIAAIIWSDICDDILQEAALTVLFALVASSDGASLATVWVGDAAQDCLDAILVSMRTLIGNETIQSIGCKVLGCLAKASIENDGLNDGSFSGAIWTVLNALQEHEQSLDVQERGIRALCNYCEHSKNSEANKETAAKSPLENGEHGADVFVKSLRLSASSPTLCECVCKLYYILSTGTDTIHLLAPIECALKAMLSILWEYRVKTGATSLLEAGLGAVANILTHEGTREAINNGKVLRLSFDVINLQRLNQSVVTAAYRLVTILCPGSTDGAHVETEHLIHVYDAMLCSPTSTKVKVAALHTLLCLGESSDILTDLLLEPILYAKLMQVRPILVEADTEAMACQLIARLFQSQLPSNRPVVSDMVAYVLSAILRHQTSRELAEAATSALDTAIAQHGSSIFCVHELLGAVLDVMERHELSGPIQTSCCCIISVVLSSSFIKSEQVYAYRRKCLIRLVAALRTLPSEFSVVHPACEALNSLVASSSYEMRSTFFADGSLATVLTSILAMYPALLAQIARVLAAVADSISSDSVLSEAHSEIIQVMRMGALDAYSMYNSVLFLFRVVEARPAQIAIASDAIVIVLDAMTSHHDEANDFLMEACRYLTIMSDDPSSRQKILNCGGVGVIVTVLDNAKEKRLQRAALTAFNKLALI
ncbi:hypothetical protein MPSEU_000902300 [Mayamaea pseudoterrestris]|nr:hypothetical protein MPSEU_000902300 [Mayamaea pseudoterrestris]